MNNFQMGHCEDCIVFKAEKRILLLAIEVYKRVVDKLISSDAYPPLEDLIILSMGMEQKLNEIRR